MLPSTHANTHPSSHPSANRGQARDIQMLLLKERFIIFSAHAQGDKLSQNMQIRAALSAAAFPGA